LVAVLIFITQQSGESKTVGDDFFAFAARLYRKLLIFSWDRRRKK
jgi:hypothetical protein